MQWWVVACTEAEVDGVRPWSGPELLASSAFALTSD